ncbi:uncharacterized protein LOC107646891 [Arachis ipaensis]|uniref:uncharacterized protein LOC107646891 n=1 Tax=Arachis ipaensis TaxID=130454 RepID=UPI0007AEE944|nr:uncharacterized protein LOC107646891 [Arachis ipaensis]
MGVERPDREGQTRPSSGNIHPKQAGNPQFGTMDTHPAPLSTPEYRTRMSYPQKLRQVEKDKQFARFVDYLKTLEIKIPFAEALEQIPSYAKFIKDILSHKKDRREVETVLFTEECSAVIQRTLPEKLQDPESFVIPCTLGDSYTRKALCDLGASINLMPLSLLRKLGIQEVKPTRICLQLADGSINFPSGVVEDMIVRVRPFAFPTDFVVLNREKHKNVSIILGRPFLATRRTLIDVQKGKVTLRVNEDQYILNAVKAMQYPDTLEECMRIDIIDPLVEGVHAIERLEEELDDILGDDMPDIEAPEEHEESLKPPKVKDGPPKLELKPLPSSLKYVFLGDGDTYPVIISSALGPQEEQALIQVLKTHRTAIGWTISDLKGISPTRTCTRLGLRKMPNQWCNHRGD